MGYIKEKKLTKHICQPGKSSLQTGILPGFWLLSTSLKLVFQKGYSVMGRKLLQRIILREFCSLRFFFFFVQIEGKIAKIRSHKIFILHCNRHGGVFFWAEERLFFAWFLTIKQCSR